MLRSAFLCSSHYLTTLGNLLLSHYFLFFFSLCTFLLILRILYNLSIHPLAKFPGPFWGSVTDFYKTYLVGTKRFHLELLALHEQYGRRPWVNSFQTWCSRFVQVQSCVSHQICYPSVIPSCSRRSTTEERTRQRSTAQESQATSLLFYSSSPMTNILPNEKLLRQP